MRIQGTFLSSRAGRRIFWTLLLAAAVPIGLFGIASYTQLSEHFRSQAQRQQMQVIKFAGMGLLDRLLVGRTALGFAARTGRADIDPATAFRGARVLLQTAHIGAGGRLLDGSVELARHWQSRNAALPQGASEEVATLTVAPADEAGVRMVMMALRRNDRPGEAWIASIDPEFLFGELAPEANGASICVLEGKERPLYCPHGPGNAASEALPARAAGASVRWNLFLRSDFNIDDWTLVAMDAPPDGATGAVSLAKLSALSAAVTLLLVGMLGSIQVRRTMVPLERLISGTRRLAERDYTARVDIVNDDEFGELSRSFNHMAERIGNQVQALHVQSSIDREILNGLNVARVLQRVAQRLEQLVPGATAAVVELDRASRMLARVHTAAAPPALVSMARIDTVSMAQAPDDDQALYADPPSWLSGALPRPAAKTWVRCAKAGDELLGLLLIGAAPAALEGADIQREIAELCDRVSVTLTSADRERRLLERATHDGLTGLANRPGLYEFIESCRSDPQRGPFTVLFIDLDRFKEVNDSMGHHLGDDLLRAVARRLQQCVPPGTLVARPGGDEFVLVQRGPRSAADALANAVCAELAQPVPLGGRVVVPAASIGMAHHPEHGLDASDLMRRADMAMYSAKSRGGGTWAWFEPALDAKAAERSALLADLRLALARSEFELHYQPRMDRQGRTIVGAEALLRWRHARRGMVPTPLFIEVLEETGLIETVGLWVLDQAARQLSLWQSQGLALDSIAVNLSTRQLRDGSLPESVAATLARHGLRPANLELEVTESIFMGDSAAAIGVLRRLHDSGIRIALDDFGTGYSSLSYLHKLPISVLKVDRSFVAELGQRENALALTRSIVALAQTLGLRVVAEGVEHQEQVDLLRALGCDELQGFLFAPALQAAAFWAFANDPRAAAARAEPVPA